MPNYFTEEEIVKDKFLFISYSHEDKTQVRSVADWLIGEGVRLWYDADLRNGDNWIDVARRVLAHENCIGTIFFNSVSAYISNPVAAERAISLEKKTQWAKDGKTYHTFVVNMGKPSTMRLVKQVLEALPDEDRAIGQALTTDQLGVILKLFNGSCIYSFMDPAEPDAFRPAFLEDMIARAPEVVRKADMIRREMEKRAKNGGISFQLGKYIIDGKRVPLEWQYVSHQGSAGVFLLKQVLDDRPGGGLTDWLNGEFKTAAFTPGEQDLLLDKLRLLSREECDRLPHSAMVTGRCWWLAEVSGALQKMAYEDGEIYEKGCNIRLKRGVRPVITVDMDTANSFMT